jgi:transposase
VDGTVGTERVTSHRVAVADAAAILGVSIVTVRRMIKRGQLEAERVLRPQGSA